MPAAPPSTLLLLHDGELGDVRALLESLGRPAESRRAHDDASAGQWDLIVTTARHALARPECLAPCADGKTPVRVVFTTEDSPTLRKQLRATGFDFLVRRPVDPAALRLLFLRLLYQGPERRAAERFPSGREVAYRSDKGLRHAVLGDLSESGCRLLHAAALRPGERVRVEVPADRGGHGSVSAAGHVLRCVRPGPGERGCTVAIAFDAIDARSLARIREALRTSIIGSDAAPGRMAPMDRRQMGRGSFRRRVVALRSEADRVLMGRDLSAGGMCVEPHPGLRVGERLRIAIYAETGGEPWVVGATVIRNDDEAGTALRFDVLPRHVARRLEGFVASLPSVEALQRGEIDSLGAVLTQILE